MKPNLFLTKSLGFLWLFGFSGHFKLLIKVGKDGNILGLVIRSLGVLGHSIETFGLKQYVFNKVTGFLWSFGFLGLFTLLIEVHWHITSLVIRSLGVLGHCLKSHEVSMSGNKV